MDRIKTIYGAIDKMARAHGTPKPDKFGGGTWDFNEEIKIWKKQIIGQEERHGYIPLSTLQWGMINLYIESERNKLYKGT